MNKLLQHQFQKHFGGADKLPEKFSKLLNVISESYDLYEKDRKTIEHSIEISSKEMIELNSELKKEKDELKKAHKEQKTFFEDINEIVFSIDMVANRLIQTSAACEKIYGYSPAEFMLDNDLWRKIIHPEDKHILEQLFQVLCQGKPVLNEYRIIHKDKSIRWIENKIIPTLGADGWLIRINGVTSDITGRKQAEKLVKENELHFRSLIEQATDAICIADASLKFIDMNPYACRVLGYSKEEALRLSVMDIIFSEDLKANPFQFDKVKTGEIIRNERRFKRKDGTSVIMEVSTQQMEDGRFIMFGHDVSERKKAEETILRSEAQLELKNKELELKNKELEHFAYIASHDLQEPLRTTSSFVDLLQQQYKGKLDERADKYLHYIADSSDRMKVLITDLLDYSRIGNKKELKQVDCNTVLNEVLQDLGTTLQETGAEISVDILPVISGYQTEIKQLFQNLIVNAIKFRKKDTVPQVSISSRKDNVYWTFTVRDNGIGIEKDHSERIFIIFQRLHTRTEYEGSGIGLAHCKKIVGLHGGDIWVESTPGEGATFYFNIPLINN